MVDLENQQTETQTAELVFSKTNAASLQESIATNESPALDILEVKLRRRHKLAKAYTYRRPTYLQYIEYA